LSTNPISKKVLGDFVICEVQAVAPAASAAPAPAAAAPAAAAPKKEAKPKDDDEDHAPPAKKEPIPPSTMGMDEWKVVYSNEDNTRNATKWLWEHYDKNGNSFWFVEYKYNDELTKTFMSLNLIGGFFQRLDEFRKRGMGTLILFGDNEKSAIAGCFVIQGLEIPTSLSECPDFPSYDFVRADPEDETQRKRLDDYFAWEGKFQGLKFNSGKVFK